ncbi:MAG: ABC transporter permease [Anaerolineales bacterium]|nr:ABC transporter permease [Anaerolineales bacterium]
MVKYVVRRTAMVLPLLLLVSAASFLLLYLVPGDPATLLAPPDATTEFVEELRLHLGLDDPLHEQYLRYLWGLIRGDLGRSYLTNRSVVEELAPRFLATIELALASLLLSIPIGLVIGIGAAMKRGSLLDAFLMLSSVVGLSMPAFWLGLVLMLVFSLSLGWLPSSGRGDWRNLVLPAMTLSTWSIAIIGRMTRASMLEVLRRDYIRTARAKGLVEWLVLYRHALRNALLPILTVIGLRFGYMLSGAVITETVFAWPGMGRFIVQAIQSRDYPNIRGALMLLAASFLVVNLLVDVLCAAADPRIRSQQ